MKNIIVLLLGLTILSANTCKKSDCAQSVYSFEAKAKILNAADSINIGDTIWLEINCPVSQLDQATGQTIQYSNAANLGTALGIGELVSPTAPVYAANDFKYILEKGFLLNNPNVAAIREYSFAENFSRYEMKLGIIPKRRGVFSIGLTNASNVYRNNDKCTKASYRIYYADTDQHLYFIRQIFGTEPDGGARATYCFKVK